MTIKSNTSIQIAKKIFIIQFMRRTYNKGNLKKLNKLLSLGPISEEQFNKVKAAMEPPKPDENEVLLKKIIQLFFQSTPIVDFDPAEQFAKLEKVPANQERFCTLMTEVIFKKTKDKVEWAKNFLFLKSKKPLQQKLQQQTTKNTNDSQTPKLQPLKINKYKFLCDILANIKMSCYRLEDLLFEMIEIHHWGCQYNNNCKGNYMQGHLAKLLFRKLIVPSGIFDSELAALRAKSFIEKDKLQIEEKEEIDEREQMIEGSQKKLASEYDVVSLMEEIIKWGPQLLQEIFKQKPTSNSIDHKPSSHNKYFICKQCFCRQNGIQYTEGQKKKNKKKKKGKNSPHDASTSQDSNEPSRKSSTLEMEDLTTTEDMDEELQYESVKYFEKVSNFLEDFRVDLENRVGLRLEMDEEGEDSDMQGQSGEKNSKLMSRMRRILYKTSPRLK